MASTVLTDIALKFSRVLEDNRIVFGSVSLVALLLYVKKKFGHKKRPTSNQGLNSSQKPERKKLDAEFWKMFYYVMKSAMPSPICRESITATVLTVALIMRTLTSLYMSKLLGTFVSAFSSRNWSSVKKVILVFSLVTIPTAGLNASLKFFTQALSSHVREKITKKVHQLYMKNMNYYKANKVGNDQLQNADQLITDDINKFSDQLARVYSNALKPVVDFLLFSLQMKQALGNTGPLTMYFWFTFAAWISSIGTSIVMPAAWKMQVRLRELEGNFRSRHKRLIESSEMIAFNGGEIPEKKIVDNTLHDITDFSASMHVKQFFTSVINGYLYKYAASAVGLVVITLPIFLAKKYNKHTSSDIASYYVECSRIMTAQAEAVVALFDLQKELDQLRGLTYRVYTLMHHLEFPEILNLPTDEENPPVFLESNVLTFRNVSIFKPDGTLLVEKLNFSVPKGTRVMITGENGCGKSSLFRVLRGLWPLSVGTIYSPPRNSLKTFYFLSQANYVPIGTLREILIYPHTLEEMANENRTDQCLWEVLNWTQTDLRVRDVIPDMDTVMDWEQVLSPGVKQRLAFARLLFHRPQYAILDECTNNMAPEVEMNLYNKCRELDITVFSISHKRELKKFHDYELHYDGKGGFQWIDLKDQW